MRGETISIGMKSLFVTLLLVCFLSVGGVFASDVSEINNVSSNNGILNSNNVTIVDGDDISIYSGSSINSDSHSINESATGNLKLSNVATVGASVSSTDSNTIATSLTGYNLTQVYGEGNDYKVLLTDSEGNPIPGFHISVNLTRLSNGLSKVYTTTTDYTGIAVVQINLAPKYYTAKSDFTGLNYSGVYYEQSSAPINSITVYDKDEISLTSTILTGYNYAIPKGGYYSVILTDDSNKPLSGKTVTFTLSKDSSSKSYSAVTNNNGVASLLLNLAAGEYSMAYSYSGDSINSPSNGFNSFIIYDKVEFLSGNAIWVQGRDMKNVDFKKLVDSGIQNIFLNYYAVDTYGITEVTNWIAQANSYGLKVHMWMQVLYHGSFQNPIASTGAINLTLLNSGIEDALYYANIPGVAGVHLDYIRYPGTASRTSGADSAVTLFVSQLTGAVKSVNTSLIVSASLMPEPSSAISAYGQNLADLTKYLDVITPMIYKGNYNAGTSWITTTTQYYVSNSGGASVWVGLQSYKSDSDTTPLSADELLADVKAAHDGGANSVAIFRYGLVNSVNSSYIDFINYESDDSKGVIVDNSLTVNAIGNFASKLKTLIEGEYKGQIPDTVVIDGVTYNSAQLLYFLTTAVVEIYTGSTSPISAIQVTSKGSSDYSDSMGWKRSDYVTLANTISEYIKSTHTLNTHMVYEGADLSYNSLVYSFTKIMAFYYNNNALPASVFVTDLSLYYYVNVLAMPSVANSGFEYVYYNSTFVNYCPNCGFYGSLLFNPKGVAEGELTCANCDSDYCAVTGKEKISSSSVYLTKVGNSVKASNNNKDNSSSNGSDIVGSVSINDIKSMASTIYNNVASTGSLPSSITLSNVEYTIAQVSFLMANAISNIYSGYTDNVNFVNVESPSASTGTVKGTLTLNQYMALIYRIISFVNTNNQMPNFDAQSSNGIGQIGFDTYTYAFAKVLVFVQSNNRLPNTLIFDSSDVNGASSSSSTSDVTYVSVNEIVSGAQRVQAYIYTNGRLPAYTTLDNVRYSEEQFLYLMCAALLEIDSGVYDNIAIMDVSSAPSSSGDSLAGTLTREEYVKLAGRLVDFIIANGHVPNYDGSNPLGKLSFDNYVYVLAYALTSYGNNGDLASIIPVNTSVIAVSSTVTVSGTGLNEKYTGENLNQYLIATSHCEVGNSQIQSLANSLVSGLTSTRDKALAIFNYVRDRITYNYYANTRYGAVGTLNAKKGNCVDQAHLVVALCRAAGIPARYVHGTNCVFSSGLVTGHVWAQILIDGVWTVADATSSRNSLGNIVNWNTRNFRVATISNTISF